MTLAACAAPPPPPPVAAAPPPQIRSGQGIDLATDTGYFLNELKGSRLDFVARYYREPDSRWPALSAGEARLLSAAGLKIVAVWESHSQHPTHFTFASGYGDATKAYLEAKAIGQPPGSAIYFAVDFNARGRWVEAVDDYFRGVAAGLTAAGGGKSDYAVGVYGSGAVCAEVKGAGLARYAWLSNSLAWDGSLGYQDWNIRQSGRTAPLSFNHDADEARAEYGGFQVASTGDLGPFGSAQASNSVGWAPAGAPQQLSAALR